MRISISTIIMGAILFFLGKDVVLRYTQNKTPNQEQEVYETHTNVIEISTTALSRKPSRIEFIFWTKKDGVLITIDWGDGQIEDVIANQKDKPFHVGHIYSTNHSYDIKIKGDVGELSLSPENNLSNRLLSIDISGHTTLTGLRCNNCELNYLHITSCERLRVLYCENNNLTSFKLEKCVLLYELSCQNNKLDASTMNSIYKNLSNGRWFFDFVIHCDEIGNHYIASNKGWKVYLY